MPLPWPPNMPPNKRAPNTGSLSWPPKSGINEFPNLAGGPTSTLPTDPRSFWRLPVRERQKVLAELGFKVGVDGKAGPETFSASWAHTRGHSAGWWNNTSPQWRTSLWNREAAKRNTPKAKVQPGGNKFQPPGPSAPPTVPPDPTATPPISPRTSSSYLDLMDQVLQRLIGLSNEPNPAAGNLYDPNVVPRFKPSGQRPIDPQRYIKMLGNPEAFAKSVTDLQYGGVLDELQRQAGLFPGMKTESINQATKWFDELSADQSQMAREAEAEYDEQVEGLQSSTKGFMEALGGEAAPGSPGVASAGTIAEAGLRGAGLSQTNFDKSMSVALGSMKTGELLKLVREWDTRLADVMNEITSTTKEKGFAYNAALEAAKRQRFEDIVGLEGTAWDQRRTLENDQFTKQSALRGERNQLLGGRYGQKRELRNDLVQQLLGVSNMALGRSAAEQQLTAGDLANTQAVANIERTYLLNNQDKARLEQLAQGTQYKFDELPPGERYKVSGILMDGLVDDKGRLKVPQNQLMGVLRQRLYRTAGYDKTTKSEQYLRQVASEVLRSAGVVPGLAKMFDSLL